MAKKSESKNAMFGRDYSAERYRLPWSGALDRWFGGESGKTINSPNGTTFSPDIELHGGYDSLWEDKKGRK